jgi:hypothetical protein
MRLTETNTVVTNCIHIRNNDDDDDDSSSNNNNNNNNNNYNEIKGKSLPNTVPLRHSGSRGEGIPSF